jgi:hypothetical protein
LGGVIVIVFVCPVASSLILQGQSPACMSSVALN